FSVKVTVTDSEGGTATQNVAAEVVNPPPVIVSLASSNPTASNPSTNGQDSVAGAFVDPGFVDTHSVTVNWRDGTAVETLTAVDQATDTFSGAHRYARPGTYTITVTVTDVEGGTATQTITAVVVDPPPQIVSLTSSNPTGSNPSTDGQVSVQ